MIITENESIERGRRERVEENVRGGDGLLGGWRREVRFEAGMLGVEVIFKEGDAENKTVCFLLYSTIRSNGASFEDSQISLSSYFTRMKIAFDFVP